jgi:hypothetical protein
MADDRIEVSRTIAAEPAAIFEVLRDPAGHVAIDASGMLMSSSGEPATAAGDSFTIHMDRDALNDFPEMGEYDVTVRFTTFRPNEEIAWTILGRIRPQIGHVYGYRLEAVEDGTRVTSYYDWSQIAPEWKDAGIFPIIPESALRATLGILARTVAPGAHRPDAPAPPS